MELYILRHGEAGKRLHAGSNNRDSARALTVVGQEEVELVAKALSRLGMRLDFIATSPLKRAYQTASIVAKELNVKKGKGMAQWDELKPEGKRQELYLKISAQFKQESSIMIVGHEPYLSTMVSEILFGNGKGDGDSSSIVLKKAGLARIDITSFQPRIKGNLIWLLTPKHLKKIAK